MSPLDNLVFSWSVRPAKARRDQVEAVWVTLSTTCFSRVGAVFYGSCAASQNNRSGSTVDDLCRDLSHVGGLSSRQAVRSSYQALSYKYQADRASKLSRYQAKSRRALVFNLPRFIVQQKPKCAGSYGSTPNAAGSRYSVCWTVILRSRVLYTAFIGPKAAYTSHAWGGHNLKLQNPGKLCVNIEKNRNIYI